MQLPDVNNVELEIMPCIIVTFEEEDYIMERRLLLLLNQSISMRSNSSSIDQIYNDEGLQESVEVLTNLTESLNHSGKELYNSGEFNDPQKRLHLINSVYNHYIHYDKKFLKISELKDRLSNFNFDVIKDYAQLTSVLETDPAIFRNYIKNGIEAFYEVFKKECLDKLKLSSEQQTIVSEFDFNIDQIVDNFVNKEKIN